MALTTELQRKIAATTAGLDDREQKELSDLEKQSMTLESQQLFRRALARSQGNPMTRSAQAAPPPPQPPNPAMAQQGQAPPPAAPPAPAPPGGAPMPQQGQEVAPAPDAGPVSPAAPMPQAGQMGEQTPVPMPGQQAQAAPPPGGAPPGGSPSIESYIDEQPPGGAMSGAEMGLEEDPQGMAPQASRRYAHIYGHLRARGTTEGTIEVYDPGTKKAVLLIRPNKATRRDKQAMRELAMLTLSHVADHGVTRTAEKLKGALFVDAGIVDYGATNMADMPKTEGATSPSTADGDSNNRGTNYDENNVTSTNEADNLTAKEQHAKRPAPGLSGKQAQNAPVKPQEAASLSGGIGDGHTTNQADEVHSAPDGNAMNSTEGGDESARDKHEPASAKDDVLEDVVTNMADESLTGKSAQMDPGVAPPPAQPVVAEEVPPMGEDAPMDAVEARIAAFYRNYAAQQIRTATRNMAVKMVKCMRLASRRMGLNQEDCVLKIAMADALMNEARFSATEDYIPMDSRTASFAIERGLTQDALVAYNDELIRRTARFMRMSDQVIAQIEDDLDQQQPVTPMGPPATGMEMMPPEEGMPAAGQMDPGMDPGMDPNMDPGMGQAGQMDPGMDPGMDPNMAPQGQMDPGMDPGMDPNMPQAGQMDPAGDPAQMGGQPPMAPQASRTRAAALHGNLPVNTNGGGGQAGGGAPTGKRDAIKAALSQLTTQGQRHTRVAATIFGRGLGVSFTGGAW